MAYTTIDNPELYFQVKAFSGTGSSNAVTYDGSENMQADLLWFKNRQQALNWMMFDSVRGITKYFYSNLTEAEGTSSSILTAIGSDGFTVGANNNVNQSSNNIINYGWKAGTSFTNDASSTGIGSIDSSGSVSDDSGFSIVSYTGTGSNGSVKHGLSTVPKIFITKRLNSTSGWVVWHESIGTNILELDGTGASQSGSSYINGTVPTSSVFSIGTSGDINASGGTFIAYCFADVKGYSKFGSYTGNGTQANGTFVYTGMKPSFVMLKRTDSTGNWNIYDNKRGAATYNPVTYRLFANENNTDASSSVQSLTFLSNGFKLYSNNADQAASGGTYIYAAFAEAPFVNSNGVPGNAR